MTDDEAVGPPGPAASVRSRPTLLDAGLVGLGAGTGCVLRYLVEVVVPDRWVSLLVVNLLGSAMLGLLVGVLSSSERGGSQVRTGRRWLSPLIGTGLLGGFTTFSTVAVTAWGSVWGIALFTAMTASCVLAAGAGHLLGRRAAR